MKVNILTIAILLAGKMPLLAQSSVPSHTAGTQQAYQAYAPLSHHQVALEVLAASKEWINDFNRGDSQKCAGRYADNALMRAEPFGVKTGKTSILGFWKSFMDSGAGNLVYTHVKIEVVNEHTVLLSANWRMNVGRGVIYQEKWEKIDDEWKYTYDDFEVLEQFEKPRANALLATESHQALEAVISASMQWITGFNNQESAICANGYTDDAVMNAIPFAKIHKKEGIHRFWDQLIASGANNLIYRNPTFEVISQESVKLSSNWSMNIGEGRIYQEKWVKQRGDWVIGYDEFQALVQY